MRPLRNSWLLLLAVPLWATPPTVSNVHYDSLSHSDIRIIFDVSSSYTAVRMRYGTLSCSGGTGGTVQVVSDGYVRFTSGETFVVGGLTAGTSYNFCPEVTSDGVSWSSGASVAATMLALPNPHPALPIPPATFDTDFPDTTGFTSKLVGTDCSIQDCIDTDCPISARTEPSSRFQIALSSRPPPISCSISRRAM